MVNTPFFAEYQIVENRGGGGPHPYGWQYMISGWGDPTPTVMRDFMRW